MGADDIVGREVRVLSAEIDGEVVALDVARGVCFGLDAIGARVWALIEAPTPVAAVCAALIREYEVNAETCRRDVLDLLAELRAEGLITVQRPAPAAAG
jgi:hypothetical protein